MIKKYKRTLIITSLMLLIPVIVGLLLWNKLPEQVPSHWGIDGEVDGWSSKTFTVFGLPALMLVLQWVCILASMADPKSKNYNSKMLKLMLWICPAISLLLSALVYGAALGYELPIEIIMPLLVGVMFIVIGNWLPKCKQTYTLGIKLPWTLASEDNWNRTHRFAGPIWVVSGMVIMVCGLIGGAFLWVLPVAVVVMIAAPTVYSYLLFKGKIK